MCLHQSSPLRRREDAPGTLSLVMSFGSRGHSRHPAVSASLAAGTERSSLPASPPAARNGAYPGSAKKPPAARSL